MRCGDSAPLIGAGESLTADRGGVASRPAANPSAVVLRTCKHAGFVALCAAAFRVVFGILKVLAKRKFAAKALAEEVLTLNPFKWAAFLGGWALYPAVKVLLKAGLEAISAAHHVKTVDGVASIAAGAICAQSARVFEISTQTELALYLAVRAAHGRLVAHVLPRLPESWQRFQHFDLITMGVTGSQILYAILFSPLSHSQAYMGFLQSCTMMTRQTCDAVAAFHRGHMTPAIVRSFGIENAPANTDNLKRVCDLVHLHASDGCNVNLVKWCLKHMGAVSLPLYVPLKITTTLLFNGKSFVRKPVATIANIVQSSLTSALFLTLYCGGPERSLCFTAQHGIRGGYKLAMFGGVTCAAATLLEPKSRRLDLALYCCMHALRSVCMTLYHRGHIPKPTRSWIFVMNALAVASLLHQLDTAPATLNSKLSSALSKVVVLSR